MHFCCGFSYSADSYHPISMPDIIIFFFVVLCSSQHCTLSYNIQHLKFSCLFPAQKSFFISRNGSRLVLHSKFTSLTFKYPYGEFVQTSTSLQSDVFLTAAFSPLSSFRFGGVYSEVLSSR